MKAVEADVAQFPTLHPLLWIDEWNTGAYPSPVMNGTQSAAFVAAVLDDAQSVGLDRACFYDAADNSPSYNFGVLNQTFIPKPNYGSFMMWHEMAGAQLATTVAIGRWVDPQDPVGAVASTSDAVIHVLVYNYDPTGPSGDTGATVTPSLARTVTVSVTGVSRVWAYRVSRTAVGTGGDPPSSDQPVTASRSVARSNSRSTRAVSRSPCSP